VTDPAARLEVTEGVPPASWDDDVQRTGGTVFHSEAWAAHRCHGGRAEPLFCTWRESGTGRVVGRALGIRPRPSRGGRLIAKILFGSPPAGTAGIDYVSPLRDWARTDRSIVELTLGSFDARQAWSPSPPPRPEERIEFILPPAEEAKLRAGMRQMTRRAIRRAEKLGLEVRTEAGPEHLKAFALLYKDTLSRLEATKEIQVPALDPEEFADSLRPLVEAGRGRLYTAWQDDTPHSACLFGVFNDGAFYIHNGATESARRSGATPLCLLAAARDLFASGALRINMGGVPANARNPASPDHGLYAFKLGLGTEAVARVGGTLVPRPLRARGAALARRLVVRHRLF
jgi:GNAT acetyltransferase-like protein